MCFVLILWNVPTMERLNRLHTPSMLLVWTSPMTHSSAEWLTVSWRVSSSPIPM